jgi:TolA-binding protein
VVYNGSGAFVDSDKGAEVKPASYELTNDEPEEDSPEADMPDKNPAAIAKKAKEEQNEKDATARLRAAERFIKNGNREHARGMLIDLVNKYPDTKAAAEASKLLK